MPLSTFVTSQNVKFNGVMDNAVLLDTAGSVRSLILSDELSLADQETLFNFITANGGALPLAGPTAGVASATFPAATVGATATGLNNVSAATAGLITIDIGGDKTGGSASGLVTSTGTAGYQVVNFTPTLTGASTTGLFAGTAATSGHQDIAWTGLIAGSATGLANDATVYTATITVDGVAKPISVVGSAAQTFTTLLAEINTDLGASATASIFSSTVFRVTSASTGVTSTVAIVDGTLFAAATGNGAIQTAVPGAAIVPATTYTATIRVDNVDKPISVLGSAAATITDLLTEINADLGGSAVATIASGDIKITSVRLDEVSKVLITPGTLFPAVTGFANLVTPVNGTGFPRAYSAVVTVDGTKVLPVTFLGTQGTTLTNVLSEINTDLGSFATAAITGGNIVITSATTGLASSVSIQDTGFLFASLTGYSKFTRTAGTAPRTYTATITVDGVAKAISIQGSAAQTFTTLVSQINTDLGASATAALVGGSIVVTSATTGVASKVVFTDVDLFRSVTGFHGFAHPVDGITNMLTAFQNSPFAEHYKLVQVGVRPAAPAVPPRANLPKIPQWTYFDGTVWKYLADDSAV